MHPMAGGNPRHGRGALTLAAAALILWSGPAQGQSLLDAMTSAYDSNPTLQAARAELRSVNEGVPQALSNWRPEVTVTASGGRQYIDQDSTSSRGDQFTTPREGALSVVQPLYRGGRTVAATESAENDVEAQRATLTSVEQDVLLAAVTAYMDVWRDQAVLQLNINNERVIQRQLEATQDRFAVGEVTRTDVAQSETRLATATADRIAAQGSLTASRAVYEEVVGQRPGTLQAPPRQYEGLPGSVEDALAAARSGNPDILASSFAEKAAQGDVQEVTGELLPTIQLRGTASTAEDTNQRDATTDRAQILVELSVPIFQQGAVASRVREAKQVSSQRRLELLEDQRRIEQETVSAWEGLQTAQAQIVSFESGVRSAEIALEGVRQENLVGARTILDILDAEQELLDAQVNLVGSQRDEVVAAFAVLAAVGRLTARDLALPVRLYDPEADYRKVRNRWFGLDAPNAPNAPAAD